MIAFTMKKKIPNILSNQRHVVSNFLDRNEGLIIGDTEDVLDIKNQYLIETYKLLNIHKQIKKLNLAYGTVSADTGDGYDDFHYYPFVEIKKKGSGLNDILKKNNHLPCGFFCIHDWATINRRAFDFYDSYHHYTNKKYFVKSIKVKSGSISIFPLSNNLQRNPFRSISYYDAHHLNLLSLGKNKKKIIDKIKKFAENSSIKFKIEGLYKFKDGDHKKYNITNNAYFSYPAAYNSFMDFVQELKKLGAKVEFFNPYYKSFDDCDKDELKLFQKELNSLKKQKNKKKGSGDLIKCQVENGIYNVYHTEIRGEDEEYDGKSYPQYSTAVLVLINKFKLMETKIV